MSTRKWHSVEDLPQDWDASLQSGELVAAMDAWKLRADTLKQRDAYKSFADRLNRTWAIETGVIEGAYAISEGATTVLIQRGLDAALISHEDTGNDEPSKVVRTIQDQLDAIQGLYQFVAMGRELGTSYIRELHRVLMNHQRTYQARDQFGNQVVRELTLGDWKRWPNHVDLPDGGIFEYCPPEHVAQEMDNLIALHRRHVTQSVPPHVEAAWLHHRFTLIHPFEDGNGRVARCLATLVLLRAEWMPLVVTRQDKPEYIAAIRKADDGDLKPLVDFFGNNVFRTLRQALSVADEAMGAIMTLHDQMSSIRSVVAERKGEEKQLQNQAVQLAAMLLKAAKQQLESVCEQLKEVFNSEGIGWNAFVDHGEPGSDKSGYNGYQIKEAARAAGFYANLQVYQGWAKLVITSGRDERFEMLIAFHGIGKSSIGYLGCSAIVYRKIVDGVGASSRTEDLMSLGEGPFGFTYTEKPVEVVTRFDKWLDIRISEGIAHWRSNL
jgi:Fic family protein